MFFEKLQNRKNDGFTLVELIVVIAILAILAGIAVPAYSGYIEKANVAADEQLLHAVNTAFSAATSGNGVVATGANLNLNAGGTVDYENLSVTPASDKVREDFKTFYAGNESSAFKTIARLSYNRTTHMFEIYTTAAQQAAVDTYNKSNLEGKTTELSGSVNSLSNALAEQIEEDLNLAFFFPSNEAYESFKAKYGLNDDSTSTEIANATILYAVSEMKGVTAADIVKITGEDFAHVDKLGETYGAIPTAALTYGVITGYVNSAYVSDEFKDYYTKNPPTGISDVTTIFNSMVTDEKFQTYMESDEKGIMADIDGYLSAMNVINGYEGTIDLKDPNAFNNEETATLIQQILGKK